MVKLTFNMYKLLFNTVLFCIFILPVYELEKIGFTLDKYLFLFIILVIYAFIIIKKQFISLVEMGIIAFSIAFCVYRKDISFLHIISIALMFKLLNNKEVVSYLKRIILKSRMVYLCLVAVLAYSLIYFGQSGRYIHSAIEDPNMSGLSLFCLFAIIRAKNKKFGNVLFVCGVLTFSKSYLLALIFYFLFEVFHKLGHDFTIDYLLMSIIAIGTLIALSAIFISLEETGKISEYGRGLNRFLTLFDYSNYYRFTVNTNVLNIYKDNVELLFTGISNDDFFRLNALYCMTNNIIFFRIRPHNYFFAYLQIYGIWSLVLFIYTYKTFKLVLYEDNNKISVPIFFYLVFLGIGATNYWLYLVVFTLIVASENI